MQLFLISGIALALFIEFLLLSKKPKSAADRILTIWVGVVVAQLVLYYLYSTGSIYSSPYLLGLDRPLPLLHGVMLFLYVSFVTARPPRSRRSLTLHFVPALLMLLYLLFEFFTLPSEQKIAVYQHQGAGFEGFNLVRRFAIVVSGIGYVGWSALLLRQHRDRVADTFSNFQRVNLRWLQFLTYSLGAIWFLVIAFNDDSVVFPAIVLFIFAIGFLGVRQRDIFAHVPAEVIVEVPVAEGPQPEAREKYQKSGLSDEASAELHEALARVMSVEGLYKESDLSIDSLADRLSVHPNHLSQVINQREGKNFYDFVNGYRIEEFKRLAADPKNAQFTLLALAYESGFSSKTSFNRCFKKATGETPSQFVAGLTLKA